MYIQLTTRCNMTCQHCCFACNARGRDISESDFKAALRLAKKMDSVVTLGGGEPTLHPMFPQFVQRAIWELADVAYDNGIPAVHMVTNGTNTEVSMTLSRLAQSGIISCALSLDHYHDRDMVDERVQRAFDRPKRDRYSNQDDHDYRSINGPQHQLVQAGRAGQGECACGDIFVAPTGNVFPCGCKRGKIGHV